MKKIIYGVCILLVFISLSVYLYAANSTSGPFYNPQYKSIRAIVTLNETNGAGDECVNVDGYIYKTVMVDVVGGTIDYDLEFTNNSAYYADLGTAVAETDDNSFEFVTAVKEVCFRVNTCTGCSAIGYVYGQGYSRDFIKSP
jgi:uncharacterized protein YxeA